MRLGLACGRRYSAVQARGFVWLAPGRDGLTGGTGSFGYFNDRCTVADFGDRPQSALCGSTDSFDRMCTIQEWVKCLIQVGALTAHFRVFGGFRS